MSEELTDDFILDLLSENKKENRATNFETTFPAHSPVRLREKHSPCASKGCGSPTWYVLDGVPYCSAHLIILLVNEVIDARIGSFVNSIDEPSEQVDRDSGQRIQHQQGRTLNL